MTQTLPIHVVAGVISNQQGNILLARRPDHLHQGGLWEFPGGKCEAGETAEPALVRELQEELGIAVQQARPLIRIYHTYPEKSIVLDVWQVERWHGQPWGREQQPLQWCHPNSLKENEFPVANYPIITAVQLPSLYLITPEPCSRNDKHFFYHLEAGLDKNISLVQLRAKYLSDQEYCYCAEKALTLCERYTARLLVNATPEMAVAVGVHGVHLTSERLWAYSTRPLPADLYIATSCHSAKEMQQANLINVDFMTISPVKATASHPDAQPLGWHEFFKLTEQANCPVFALGGMTTKDVPTAWAHGGQGIAAIRALWE
jgi:8-oxo-dGTP diphosphatase